MTRREVLHMDDMVLVDRAVRISGTSYDRRRKLDKRMVNNIRIAYEAGRSIAELADRYGVTQCAIRYWVDPDYRAWKNGERKKYAQNTKQDKIDVVERGAYKKYLVIKRRAVLYK